MQMQHVYQPVMIKELLSGGGKASIRNIAAAFLARDASDPRQLPSDGVAYFVLPKRHAATFFDLFEPERRAISKIKR
jgi:hypothetical protein